MMCLVRSKFATLVSGIAVFMCIPSAHSQSTLTVTPSSSVAGTALTLSTQACQNAKVYPVSFYYSQSPSGTPNTLIQTVNKQPGSPVTVSWTPSSATTWYVQATASTAGLCSYTSNIATATVTAPTPQITSLSPTTGPAGTSVTITGTNFGTSGNVTFNGVNAFQTSWSRTSIIVSVPSGLPVGVVPLIVTANGVSSSPASFTVTSAPVSTSVNLTSSLNPASYGGVISYAAKVTASDGSVPQGSVQLLDGTHVFAGSVLTKGGGTFVISNLTPGSHTISVSYSGDSAHSASSGALSGAQVIQSNSPPTHIAVKSQRIVLGDALTASISVTSSPGLLAQGSVTCSAPSISPVTQTLNGHGLATLVLPGLPLGSNLVTCNFASSTSSATSSSTVNIVVAAPGTAAAGTMITGRLLHRAAVLSNGNALLIGGEAAGPKLGATTQSSEFYSLTAGASVGPSMNVAREQFTATVMPDGTVLVCSGLQGASATSSAEYYDPVTNTFKFTGSLTTARFLHTATLLPTGKVLIAGGENSGNGLVSTELYDPLTGSFSAGPAMHTARLAHTATILNNGTVLITGGFGSNSNGAASATAELYDPIANTFTSLSNMTTGRGNHTATLLNDGTVLIAGGTTGNPDVALSSAEIYDPTSNTFTATGNGMSAAHSGGTATALGNGLVLVAGGFSLATSTITGALDLYNPTTKLFSSAGTMLTPRADFTSTAVGDNAVLFAGGLYVNSAPYATSNEELYTFDVATGSVNLKYVVLGVVYAPPGSLSSVTYGSTSSIAETTAIDENIATTSSVAVTTGFDASIKNSNGGLDDSESLTSTVSYGYSTDSSKTYVLEKQMGNTVSSSGPTTSSIGVDHDYDLIFIWFNPALGISLPNLKTSTGLNIVDWTGYTYNGCTISVTMNCDPNNFGMPDVVGIPVLCLKNPYISPACTQYSIYTSRAWDLSGIGGLTLSDYQNILAQDPFAVSSNYSPQTDSQATFNEVSGTVQYPIPAPGQGSQTYMGSAGTMNTTTTQQIITRMYGVSFSLDSKVTGGFIVTFSNDIKSTIGTTWMHKTTSSYSSVTGTTAAYTVHSPSGSDNYSGPPIFDVWHDNLFGTFMFFAPSRPTVPSASITSNVASLVFGTTALGSMSPAQVVTLTNNSTVSMVMSPTSFAPFFPVASSSSGSFTVPSASDHCTGQTLAAGSSCTVSVQFSPLLSDLPNPGSTTVSGTLIAGGVEVSSGSTNSYITLQIPVSGTGTR